MAEAITAAMWAIDMAELTGCDEIIWVREGIEIPEDTHLGQPMELTFPDAAGRESLMLRLRGGMAGYVMYAVPVVPGAVKPWAYPGLLLTDDPGTARWFAALPGAKEPETLNGDTFLRVLHLAHSHTQALAALPEERMLWALGADIDSLCRAISLGLGAYEGRRGDWLTARLTLRGGTAILEPEGKPYWLRIGEDGKLWPVEPWSVQPPRQGIDRLVASMPGQPLRAVAWQDVVLAAAAGMNTPENGVFGIERWYPEGISYYVNQWRHTEHIVPRPPLCFEGEAPVEEDWETPEGIPPQPVLSTAQAQALLQALTGPKAGKLHDALRKALEKMAESEKNT